jgi:hypothetical protein
MGCSGRAELTKNTVLFTKFIQIKLLFFHWKGIIRCVNFICMSGLDFIPLLVENMKSTQPEKIILFGSYA